jgi:hypothetical protein
MNPKKYIISYDWKSYLNGHYSYNENFETNSFLIMIVKFLFLKLKYETIDIEYRK